MSSGDTKSKYFWT